MNDSARTRKLLTELRKRERIFKNMLEDSFPPQRAFVEDESKFLCAKTTRRAGKSSAAAMKILRTGIKTPGCSMLYTGLTDDSAWRILWKDVLRPMGKRYGINLKPKKAEKAVEFLDYGSVLYFIGLENSEEEMSKVLGQKYALVVIDEAAKYRQNLETFIFDVVLPGVADYNGQIAMVGMGAKNPNKFFYDVTIGEHKEWKLHFWTWEDNRYTAENIREQLRPLIQKNPKIVETPGYKMNYLNLWAIEDEDKIYTFNESKDYFDELPAGSNWYFVMGVDLGYNPDPTAFVICAYRDYDPILYVVDVFRQKNMDLTAVAERIKFYEAIYNLNRTIIDAGHKQSVEELKSRHDLRLIPAEKAGKADFIQLCNDDLLYGRIKVRSHHGEPLVQEWRVLCWDQKAKAKGVLIEPPRAKNNCSDAFLYAWRYCYNYVDRGQAAKKLSIDEKIDQFWEKEENRMSGLDPLDSLAREFGYE